MLKMYLMGPKYAATLVAEELFGGSSLSLLFTNVREKASLAYYASSMFDAFRGSMLVQTGIEEKRFVSKLLILFVISWPQWSMAIFLTPY